MNFLEMMLAVQRSEDSPSERICSEPSTKGASRHLADAASRPASARVHVAFVAVALSQVSRCTMDAAMMGCRAMDSRSWVTAVIGVCEAVLSSFCSSEKTIRRYFRRRSL